MAQPWHVLARPLGAIAISGGLLLGAGGALAQASTPMAGQAGQMDLSNAPVDMHEGTCANPTLDPWAELGRLQRQGADDVGDDEGLIGDIEIGEDDEGFLTEDADNDGVLDDGEDLNDNGILDTGIDENGDGVLDENEIAADGEMMAPGLGQPAVYVLEGEIDSGFEPLFDQQNVIAVHQSSEQYENIVACGNLGGIEYQDEQEVVVGLRAGDGSGIRGFAVFEFDPAIFGEGFTAVTVYVFEDLPSQRENLVAATPEA